VPWSAQVAPAPAAAERWSSDVMVIALAACRSVRRRLPIGLASIWYHAAYHARGWCVI